MKRENYAEQPSIAVISPIWIGHIPGYHSLVVQRANKIGCRVISITPGGEMLPGVARSYCCQNQLHQVALGSGLVPENWHGWFARVLNVHRLLNRIGIPTALRARRNWRELGRVLQNAERAEGRPFDFAFIVYLGFDLLIPGVSPAFVGKAFPCPWGGIWNGPTPGRDSRSPYISNIWACEAPLRARNCRVVWVPHRSLAARLRSFNLVARVEAMPEIADLSPPSARSSSVQRIIDAAAGRRITVLLGAISLRKGIRLLIETARIAMQNAPDLFFVAAGEFSRDTCGDEYREIEAAAAAAPTNFLFLPSRIPDGAEFNAHVAAADVLFAVYRNFKYQSNLLTKAAHFEKPILVAPGEVMADCTRDFNLGAVVPSSDPYSVLSCIRSLLKRRRADGQPWQPRFKEYAALNDATLLDALLADAIMAHQGQ